MRILVPALGGLGLLAFLAARRRTLREQPSLSEDMTTWVAATSYSNAIQRVATAIARAEGYYAGDTVPRRANNPGDLKRGGTTIGGITVYDSPEQGWSALYRQLSLIITGQSQYYTLNMSIADMARRWTATESGAWARNVADALGVSVETPLSEVLI